MELWLVRDVPSWLVAVVLIGGLALLSLALDVLIHRRIPHSRLHRHNDVTGIIVSVVGVAYAIVVGLCVVGLWEHHTTAEQTVREEAATLAALGPASAVFDPGTQRRIADEVIRYEKDIITDWQNRDDDANGRRLADLDALAATVGALQPTTEAQRSFVLVAMEAIGRAEQLRLESISEADDEHMSGVMWIGVLISTTAILCLCLFFGLDDDFLRRILLVLSSAVIATNIFVIVQLNYPYYGTFSVSTDSYHEVIKDLETLR